MDRTRIERFVRDALGCTCPSEVFAVVRDQYLDNDGTHALRRIMIGDRLLVYLIDGARPPDPVHLTTLIREGRQERDRRGLNRFRLVIATEDPATVGPELEASFHRTPEADERVHLHVLERSAIAGL
jgi:hypothetical protein